MRAPSLALVAVAIILAGCASPEPIRLATREPPADPYGALARATAPAAPVAVRTERIARPAGLKLDGVALADALARLLPLAADAIRVEPDGVAITAPGPAIEACRAFLADRVRFAGRRVTVEAHMLRVSRERLPRPASLRPAGPGAWAIISERDPYIEETLAAARRAEGELDRPRVVTVGATTVSWMKRSVVLVPEDGVRTWTTNVAQVAYIGGAVPFAAGGIDPWIAVAGLGDWIDVTPALAGEGRTLALALEHRHVARRAGEDLALRVPPGPEPAPAEAGIEVELLALVESHAAVNVALREGEALFLVRSAPESANEALVTLVAWRGPPAR